MSENNNITNSRNTSPALFGSPAVKRVKTETPTSTLSSVPLLSSNASNTMSSVGSSSMVNNGVRFNAPANMSASTSVQSQQQSSSAIPTVAGTVVQGSAPSSSVDPEMLSDALLSAGVDLKEEESLLSRSLYGTGAAQNGPSRFLGQSSASGLSEAVNGPRQNETADKGTGPAPLPSVLERIYKYQQEHQNVPFLDPGRLQLILENEAKDSGLSLPPDSKEIEAILSLISYACQEWVSDVVISALVLSRHRRRSRNNVHSETSRALRAIAQKEKESEDKWLVRRAAILGENEFENEGLEKPSKKEKTNDDGDGESKGKRGRNAANEEINYSAANATVNMMTLGTKRKYSWLLDGAGGAKTDGSMGPGGLKATGAGMRSDKSVRYREAREEQGLVVRDLLAALEHQRTGALSTLLKGYAKLRH